MTTETKARGASSRAAPCLACLLVLTLVSALACRTEDPAPVPSAQPRSPARDLPQAAAAPADEGPPLSREEIRVVVRAKMASVRACFNAGLERNPDIGGRLVLRIDIEPSGRTGAVELTHDEVGEGVGACIADALSSWQFPRPRGGQTMTIAYPFVFSSERSLRTAGLPRVEGTIEPRAIGAVFDARHLELDECIADDAAGSVELAFIIDDSGEVTRVSVLESELPTDSAACVSRTIASWRFPPSADGDETRVNHELSW